MANPPLWGRPCFFLLLLINPQNFNKDKKGEETQKMKLMIEQDEDPANPLTEFDLLGKFWWKPGVPTEWMGFKNQTKFIPDTIAAWLPLYVMNHSGQSISTSSGMFEAVDSQGWDWWFAGYIFCTYAQARKEYGFKAKFIPADVKEKILSVLEAEVNYLNAYWTGDCWMWTLIDDEGEIIDSCGGYYERESLEAGIKELKEKYPGLEVAEEN